MYRLEKEKYGTCWCNTRKQWRYKIASRTLSPLDVNCMWGHHPPPPHIRKHILVWGKCPAGYVWVRNVQGYVKRGTFSHKSSMQLQ